MTKGREAPLMSLAAPVSKQLLDICRDYLRFFTVGYIKPDLSGFVIYLNAGAVIDGVTAPAADFHSGRKNFEISRCLGGLLLSAE